MVQAVLSESSIIYPYSICALSTLYPYSIQHFLLSIYRRAGFKRRCYTGFSPHLVCYRWLQYQSNIGETPSGQPTISRVKNALHPYSTHTPLIFYAHFIYTLSHSTCAPPILFPDDTHTPWKLGSYSSPTIFSLDRWFHHSLVGLPITILATHT